ncbi:PD-(D/E)XK nuclease family protein [Campylobacter novaezeelandiae]|uniref:PD-(D/E)XK nuclease family protein n=1 Tax=Campylobacter novaezeelandiae TaxID=2267891 RepID=UPI00103719E3|nr:PD-(D/E)XK nuclease family protein [Campylobacter novaezeelandiae]TBR78801.1 PD-(D/E)XK nuclease family protein [Campylobacter novaezeelandiae]TBR82241.1 PD-(D/E)XK nuclease family protein [Campylobacter novaezeelandiae]
MKLFVFSSLRALRKYYEEKLQENTLVNPAMSIAEFIQKLVFSEYFEATRYECLLLMQKACEQTKNLEQSLKIPSNFFAFLKNNAYLFSFFKELSLEKKDINELKFHDAYAQYDEHLQILEELFKNYLTLLKEHNLYDEISLPLDYKINVDFLKNYNEIIFDFQGFLNAFEVELLLETKKLIPIKVQFNCTKFNKDFLNSLSFLQGFDFKENYSYLYDLNQNQILKECSFLKESKISYKSFNLRSLQAAFVFEKINTFLKAGISAKDIVVITPDEKFVDILRLYDRDNVLNFASGKSIKNTHFYHKLRALYEGAKDDEFEYERNDDFYNEQNLNKHLCNLHFFSSIDFQEFKKKFNENVSFEFFESLIHQLLEDSENELKDYITQELIFIKELIKTHKLDFSQILELFFMQIDNIKLSSVGGGEVTVMGLLESRGLSFDGVIIVDFNDDFIPKRVSSELFLNNEIRKKAGLITHTQRENLQRHYYYTLIAKAKLVGISFVENEEKIKSRFLNELEFALHEDKIYSNNAYLKYFQTYKCSFNLEPITHIKAKHDYFKEILSFSKLHLLINYGLDYYYKYVLRLKEPKNLNNTLKANEFGSFIHKALEIYYTEVSNNHFNYEVFMQIIKNAKQYNIDVLSFALIEAIFKEFQMLENEHFKQGYMVEKCEFPLSREFITDDGVKINTYGRLDRIDCNNKEKMIIDYKSGKVDDKSYQLAFYKFLLEDEYSLENIKACFYDLKNIKIINENAKNKSVQELKDLFNELAKEPLEKEFYNQKNNNAYSPYVMLYKKEFKL